MYALFGICCEALEALTVNGDSWETISLLDMIRRLYQPRRVNLEERGLLAQRFSAHWPAVKDRPEVQRLAQEVLQYQSRLALLGLRDGELVRNLSAAALLSRSVRHLSLICLWLPLSIFGAPLHIPLALSLAQLSRLLAPRKDAIASAKLLAGLLAFGGLYICVALLIGEHWGWEIGVLALFLLPLSGLATLKAFERGHFLGRIGRHIFFALRAPHTLRTLRRERRRLQQEIHTLVDQLAPEGLERLFPRSPRVQRESTERE